MRGLLEDFRKVGKDFCLTKKCGTDSEVHRIDGKTREKLAEKNMGRRTDVGGIFRR